MVYSGDYTYPAYTIIYMYVQYHTGFMIFLHHEQVMISGQIASQKSKDAFKTTDRWTADIPVRSSLIGKRVNSAMMSG